MQRRHLFEFNEQHWLPESLRRLLHQMLLEDVRGGKLYQVILPLLKAHFVAGDYQLIRDLAAGDGQLWRYLLPMLQSLDLQPQVELADRHPPAEFKIDSKDAQARISYVNASQDLRTAAFKRQDFVVLIAALHHLKPAEAAGLLNKVAASGSGFLALEFTQRQKLGLRDIWQTFRAAGELVKAVKHKSAKKSVWFMLPFALEKMYTWDVMVSRMRSYTAGELEQLTTEALHTSRNQHYNWHVDQIRDPASDTMLQYVLGYQLT